MNSVGGGVDTGFPFEYSVSSAEADLFAEHSALQSAQTRDIRVIDRESALIYISERNARYLVKNGNKIVVDETSVESDAEVLLDLLGPLFRLLLLQQGEFVLHGSVVDIDGQTAAFIAPSGHGKSTVAAGLYDRGHDVLADDAGIVKLQKEPEALSGPSVLKLHKNSAAMIKRYIEPIFPDGLEHGKRFYQLENNEPPHRTSLDAVYLLQEGEDIEIEQVTPREATVTFVDNSWSLPDPDRSSVAENFQRCSTLAAEVPVTRLQYPRSFDVFDDVLVHIEQSCNQNI